MVLRPYQYRCDDRSIIAPKFKQYLVSPLLPFVPRFLPANLISIGACFCLLFALYLALRGETYSQITFLCVPILFVSYAIGDNLDGMQARRTQTTSPLGEYCDHLMDAFATGLMAWTLIMEYRTENILIASVLVYVGYLAHAATMYQQFQTGWLRVDIIGPLEAIFYIAFLSLLGFFEKSFLFLTGQTSFALSRIEVVFVVNALLISSTFFSICFRVGKHSRYFYSYILSSTVLLAFGILKLSMSCAIALLILHGIFYICGLMHGHIVDGKQKWPDFLVPTVGIFGLLGIFEGQLSEIGWYLVGYQGFIISMAVTRTFSHLKEFWIWSNPEPV